MKNKTILQVVVGLLLVLIALYYLSLESPKISNETVAQKKSRFIALIVPAVNAVYIELENQYQTIIQDIKAHPDSKKLATLRQEYRVVDNQDLLKAIKPHPRSIAIAQAAMESAWATSRFYREAYNIFGVWSFNANEPRIAAREKRGKKTIWIKKYPSIKDSIRGYYRVLARSKAFKEFRTLKMQTNNPFELVKKLDRYSEKGARYGEELTDIIRFNEFTKYD